MPIYSVGKTHSELSNWLIQDWLKEGPPVCFIEGFSGVGKTSVARQVVQNSGWDAVIVNMPEADADQADNLFLDLATELSSIGIDDLATAVTEGKQFDTALPAVLVQRVLIVIDEFQRALDETGRPVRPIMHLLERLANRPRIPGRVLFLTNRMVERSKWSEAHPIRTLHGLSSVDAENLLDRLLTDLGRGQEIPTKQRRDVVNWLGGNPRAIHVLVAALERSSLDELIGRNPEIWEAIDRQVSAELLHRLERELLERTMELLDPETVTLLRRLAVHRKPVKREAIDMLLPDGAEFATARDALINRFLMEQHSGWFSLNPVVREISLQELREKAGELKQAHSRAADHYMRHFRAKEIVGSGKLGGYFVEARYHLVQSRREAELAEIAGRFEAHLKASFSSVSPVPSQLDELNERIATLSALLETPGSKGLEYYLARLYEARHAEGDTQKALRYAQRATGPRAPADSWVLRLRLEAKVNRPEKVLRVARDGIAQVPVDKGVVDLYLCAGELLARAGKADKAIALLKDGIAKVPVDKGVAVLYQSAGELLAQTGKADEAIALLKVGIAKVPVGSVAPLYQSAGELLAQAGKTDDAIALLKDGIAKVPADKGVVSLYQSTGILLAQTNKADDAIALLKEGIQRIRSSGLGHEGLVECALLVLMAQQDIRKLDTFLSTITTLRIEEHALALGQVLRLIVLRNWDDAAIAANRQAARFSFYRPLVRYETFGWLTTKNVVAAKNAVQRIPGLSRLNDPLDWLATWVSFKDRDPGSAREKLSAYLNRPVDDSELNEQFLLQLWDTAPAFGSRVDLAYYFPILPASLTGLPSDVVRTPYGPSVISQLSSHQERPQSSQVTLPAKSLPSLGESELPNWPAWMDEVLNPSGNKPRVDMGIVIALEEEFRELAPQIKTRPYYNPDIKQYYYLFERSSANAAFAPYRCVVTFMATMGPTDAGMVGDRLIAQFNPVTIVSIGIAGSMDKDVLVGDVVVADQTDEYLASSKAIETKDKQDWDFQFSGNPYKSDPAYVAHAMHLKYAHTGATQNWEDLCKRKLLEWLGSVSTEDLMSEHLIGKVPGIHTGHIASGPIVGAANQFVQRLKERRDRKFLALEMESAGVLNAAHKRAVSSLIIRGISDYSDERKTKLDEIGSGALRRYAMNNALALLWVLMDLRLINSTN